MAVSFDTKVQRMPSKNAVPNYMGTRGECLPRGSDWAS